MKLSKVQLRSLSESIYKKHQFVADQVGKKQFIVDRVKMALEVGAKTYSEILFIAMNAPLLRPNKYAIQSVKENIQDYLNLVGDNDLKPYHAEITELAIEYHEHILYPSISTSSKTTAVSHDPRCNAISTWQGLSSELHHRIPLGYDWDAIANFIITDSTENGKALQLQEEQGEDTLVYKSTPPEGCETCVTVYKKHDGTPLLFKVKDLIQNNSAFLVQRIHHDKACSQPVSGTNHIYCNCMLHKYTGFESWAKNK